MRIEIWCGKCGEHYYIENLTEKKDGFSFDLFHADTSIAKNLHCERIGQHLQGYFGKEENIIVNKFLEKLSEDLEPKTHCCECTRGGYYQKHAVHIQYLGCDCDPEKYVLKVND